MEMGAADMVISHYKKDDGRASTRRFIMTGQGEWPRFLYSNGGSIIGPNKDPANIRNCTDATEALLRIARTPGAVLHVTNVAESNFTINLLREAGGPELIANPSSHWLQYVKPPNGAGDGAMVVDAEAAGAYVMWGTVPFLKFLERHPNFNMEILVWEDQILHHPMVSIVVKKEAFPDANIEAAQLFQAHLLTPESQGYIKAFRMPGWDYPVWFPRGVDNLGHKVYAPYDGEDPDNDIFISPIKVPSCEGSHIDDIDGGNSNNKNNNNAAVEVFTPLTPLRMHRSRGGVLDVQLHVRAAQFVSDPMMLMTRSYNGTFPGPVLRVKRGDTLRITLVNELAGTNIGTFWSTSSGTTGSTKMLPNVNATNIHLHGMHIPSTPYNPTQRTCGDNIRCIVPPGETLVFEHQVPADHPTGTFWYHPHVHGTTALQVGGLLAGPLIVEDDPAELSPRMAAMPEMILMIQMLYFKSLGVVTHDTIAARLNDATFSKHDGAMENYVLVNGEFRPSASVRMNEEQRLRVINANEVANMELVVSGCHLVTIAYDGVYLDNPLSENVVVVPPGGRVDIVLVCTNMGEYWLESVQAPERDETMGHHYRINSQILKFIVTSNSAGGGASVDGGDRTGTGGGGGDHTGTGGGSAGGCHRIGGHGCGLDSGLGSLPPRPAYLLENLLEDELGLGVAPYSLKMSEGSDVDGDVFLLNDVVYTDGAVGASAPPPRMLKLAELEEWHVWSDSPAGSAGRAHPFHSHTNHFQVVGYESEPDSTTSGGANNNGGTSSAIDYSYLIRPGQWRDTVLIPGGRGKVRIRFKPERYCGDMVVHCHILLHGDQGMMQTVHVGDGSKVKCTDAPSSSLSSNSNSANSNGTISSAKLAGIVAASAFCGIALGYIMSRMYGGGGERGSGRRVGGYELQRVAQVNNFDYNCNSHDVDVDVNDCDKIIC